MNARIVLTHDEILDACADWIRRHGVTDFSGGDIVIELASTEIHGAASARNRFKATVDVNLKQPEERDP